MLPRAHNIIGRWCPSAGATGYRLIDRVGSNHGTLTGMDAATDWVPSGGKLALDLDGSGDYVSGSGNSFSVRAWSVWFNPRSTINSSSSFQTILQTRFGTNNSFLVSFGSATILLSNEYITITDTTGNHRIGVTDGGSISAGSWHNLFVNSNYTGYEIWLDGVKKSLTTTGTVGASPIFNALRIGCFDGDGGGQRGFFNGLVDDSTIYNVPLTSSEILDIYRLGRGYGVFDDFDFDDANILAPAFRPYWASRRSQLIGGGI
jgi:hypothetical protein